MKTTVLFLTISSLCFAQKTNNLDNLFSTVKSEIQNKNTLQSISNGTFNDLNEQQAFANFSSSNIRQELGIQIREFNYSLFLLFAKQFKTPLSKMIIMNKTENKVLIEQLKTAYKGAENPMLCKDCYYLPFKTSFK